MAGKIEIMETVLRDAHQCLVATRMRTEDMLPIAAALGRLTAAHVIVVGLVTMTVFVFWDAANFGAVPTLVGKDRIREANNAVWGATQVFDVPPLWVATGVLLAALPAGITPYLFAQRYGACHSTVASAASSCSAKASGARSSNEFASTRSRSSIPSWPSGAFSSGLNQ